ncbi:sigma-70 family RNA polymerase sigma factor [Acidipropionibacterium virtanenii]|uniref:RNA polymerase sigma factor SigA2 n=1 Tax=Acidipropionibacterium virtanenii TaxID=2057246 RepID=A0A344UUS8_9ACTN|nr:sigma-70 family RNA polymerase sigma factor [Acidipropionibacterium virtanenii]AXE39026.1 RNA polymerase sigma factor SigA2 [Acidipropionibacterium virtanenii]
MEFKEFVSAGRSRLAAQEEWELFGRLEAGVLAAELLDGLGGVRHDATDEELRVLVAEGRLAAVQLWRATLGMAVKVAANLAQFSGGPGEDMEQAGCVGLGEAMQRFDRAKGVRFITFAWVWVRRRVSEELLSSDAARTVWRRRTERAVDRRALSLAMTLGREPSDDELAASMGVDEHWIRQRRDPGGDVLVGDPTSIAEAEHHPSDRWAAEWLGEAIAELPRLQRRIIELRFGLGGPSLPRHVVAADLRVTLGVVRRLESQALAILREARTSSRDAA